MGLGSRSLHCEKLHKSLLTVIAGHLLIESTAHARMYDLSNISLPGGDWIDE